jgi:uncharacterized membrane protein YhaH (DUF805 family)
LDVFLFNIIFTVIARITDKIAGTEIEGTHYGWFYILFCMAVFIPAIAVGVRRVHDVGFNGWFILVPVFNFILACKD